MMILKGYRDGKPLISKVDRVDGDRVTPPVGTYGLDYFDKWEILCDGAVVLSSTDKPKKEATKSAKTEEVN